MSRFEEAKVFISHKMMTLSETYKYHNLDHIFDVLESAVMIAKAEGISDNDLELLKIAALFHDSGFIINPDNHEAMSCSIAKKNLPVYGYTEEEIKTICGLIMATKIPQTPHNKLEEILCDADLDYLGRDDFYTTGNKVFFELRDRGKINSEGDWNKLQVQFLESHNYFTDTSRKLRKPKKLKFLKEVKSKI